MAIAQTGSASTQGSGSTASITHGLTINSGDLVFAYIVNNRSSDDIVLQGASGGASPWIEDRNENGENSSSYAIQYVLANGSEPATYTFAMGGSTNWSIHLRVFSGVHQTTPLDVTSNRNTDGGDSTSVVLTGITTLTDGAVAVAVAETDTGSGSYDSIDNSFLDVMSQSNRRSGTAYKIITTAGAVGTTTFTMSASDGWEANMISFAPAAGGAATNPKGVFNNPFTGPFGGPI